MATRTSYLNLIKPDYTDAADIADINANMDTLDNTIQGLDETGSKSLTAHNNATDAHQPILNAIKEITGMSSYDIAPSKTIAAIIPLLGLGGIVAQKLESIGYVKFANGLIIQWGEVSIPQGVKYSDFTLPIACNLLVVSTADLLGTSATSMTYDSGLCWGKADSSNTRIRILTTNDFAGGLVYIALGTSV